jgi:UPF0176 protein
MTALVLNVSGYRFVALDDLPARRLRLVDAAQGAGLLGTVLLAEEGINLVLAGQAGSLRGFLGWLSGEAPFADLKVKESWSAHPPFRRLKVKIKREIIRMMPPGGDLGPTPAVRPVVLPASHRAPSVAPATLARWLSAGHDDAGRPVVMLDTRNAFEVNAGAFEGAVDWRLQRFSDFPAALTANRDALAGKAIVSYCTGGIRCEKAALLMQAMGLDTVYQLEGGILKYFEQTDSAPHWRGTCFVFDERDRLAPDLAPAAARAGA